MQLSKINLPFKICQPGYLFLMALLMVDLSFGIFQGKSVGQKIVIVIIAGYLTLLMLKKYSTLKIATVGILLLGFISINLFSKVKTLQLTENTIIKVYPDQVKIKDDWLSGIGHAKNIKVSISGKVAKSQENIIKQGYPVYITQISGDIGAVEPASNLGQFDYRNYYAAKNIFQRIKFKSCNIKSVKVTYWDKIHYYRFCLQQYFAKMPRLLGFLQVN